MRWELPGGREPEGAAGATRSQQEGKSGVPTSTMSWSPVTPDSLTLDSTDQGPQSLLTSGSSSFCENSVLGLGGAQVREPSLRLTSILIFYLPRLPVRCSGPQLQEGPVERWCTSSALVGATCYLLRR